jgi:transposase-like protein
MSRGKQFTTEFKREAARLALTSGRPRHEIAAERDILEKAAAFFAKEGSR